MRLRMFNINPYSDENAQRKWRFVFCGWKDSSYACSSGLWGLANLNLSYAGQRNAGVCPDNLNDGHSDLIIHRRFDLFFAIAVNHVQVPLGQENVGFDFMIT